MQQFHPHTQPFILGITARAAPQTTPVNGLQEITPQPNKVLTKWGLWTSGKTQLPGANIWQSLVLPDVDAGTKGYDQVGPPFNQEDFNQLAALDANYVVLSVPGIFTENSPYQVDPEVQQNLDNLLDMTAKENLFATIAFRAGPEGRNGVYAARVKRTRKGISMTTCGKTPLPGKPGQRCSGQRLNVTAIILPWWDMN